MDTNVLVRYLVQDDPTQARLASRLIENFTAEEPGFIGAIVLAEIAWVLEDVYDLNRAAIAEVVEGLLQTRTLFVQDAEVAWRALRRFRNGVADFADYLIERSSSAAGCAVTLTFDRKAARDADCAMQLLSGS